MADATHLAQLRLAAICRLIERPPHEDVQLEMSVANDLAKDIRAVIARIRTLEDVVRPFAEAASHLHPSQPDEALTLDGIEARHWRAAANALSAEIA